MNAHELQTLLQKAGLANVFTEERGEWLCIWFGNESWTMFDDGMLCNPAGHGVADGAEAAVEYIRQHYVAAYTYAARAFGLPALDEVVGLRAENAAMAATLDDADRRDPAVVARSLWALVARPVAEAWLREHGFTSSEGSTWWTNGADAFHLMQPTSEQQALGPGWVHNRLVRYHYSKLNIEPVLVDWPDEAPVQAELLRRTFEGIARERDEAREALGVAVTLGRIP